MSTNTFSFRVTDTERRQLLADVQAEGFSNTSDLVRSRVFGYSNSTPASYAALATQVEQLEARVDSVVPTAISEARRVMGATTPQED